MAGITLRVVQVDVGLVFDAKVKLLLVEVVDVRPAAVKLLLVDIRPLLPAAKLVLVDDILAEDGGPLLLRGSRQILHSYLGKYILLLENSDTAMAIV